MKRFISFVLAVMLAFAALPYAALAAVDSQSTEFQNYLLEVGMTEEEFVAYLSDFHDYSLEEFESFEELTGYLGALLDEENLQEMLVEFEIGRASCRARV